MHPFVLWDKQEEGQGLVEYSFVLLLIAMVAIVALAFLGNNVLGFFESLNEILERITSG
jgi:Flp pilus assembly pilin Flp